MSAGITFQVIEGEPYIVAYLAGQNMFVAYNNLVTSDDYQKAANFFLKLIEQKRVQEDAKNPWLTDQGK